MAQKNFKIILDELEKTLSNVDDNVAATFQNEVVDAPSIFVAGKGRSGFVANSFAMRLNQLGKRSYVVGESTTPSIQSGDLLLIISGSGSTVHLKLLAEKAKDVGATLILISTKSSSPISELAAHTIVLPAGTKHDAEGSAQPLGSLFEQSSQLFLDAMVLDLMSQLNVSEETMQNNHANLE